MFDVRYHLFYFIAIFFMLGFGILIGASYYGPIQVSHQKKAFDTLAAETNRVVQDRDQARDRLAKDENVLAALRPTLVQGKLASKRVVLLQTGDYADATEAANTALSDAGATVVGTVVLTDKWGALTPKQRDALHSVADPADATAQDSALLAALASALTSGVLPGSAQATNFQALQAAGLVTVSGEMSQPCALFVLVGGNRDDTPLHPVDGPLASALKAASAAVTVVGCEPFTAATSSIPAYQAAGVATVDCIDLPLGQLALSFALRGEDGDYGLKPTARQQLPASLGGTPGP